MAKIELSALASQCIDRRTPDAVALHSEVAAWERTRTEANFSIDWLHSRRRMHQTAQALPRLN